MHQRERTLSLCEFDKYNLHMFSAYYNDWLFVYILQEYKVGLFLVSNLCGWTGRVLASHATIPSSFPGYHLQFFLFIYVIAILYWWIERYLFDFDVSTFRFHASRLLFSNVLWCLSFYLTSMYQISNVLWHLMKISKWYDLLFLMMWSRCLNLRTYFET